VSQRLDATPSPQDAASALASTTAQQPELANRRDIPLTAFDLLSGSYAASKRARAAGLGVLALTLGFLGWTVFGVLRTSWEVSSVREEALSLLDTDESLYEGFGSAVSGVPTGDLLSRDRSVSAGLAALASEQGDFLAVFRALSSLDLPGARVVGVAFGRAAAQAGASSDAAKEPADTATVPVRILISGDNLASVITLADRIRQLPELRNVNPVPSGTSAVVTADILLNNPPKELLDRLLTLGVRSIAAAQEDLASIEGTTGGSPDTNGGGS